MKNHIYPRQSDRSAIEGRPPSDGGSRRYPSAINRRSAATLREVHCGTDGLVDPSGFEVRVQCTKIALLVAVAVDLVLAGGRILDFQCEAPLSFVLFEVVALLALLSGVSRRSRAALLLLGLYYLAKLVALWGQDLGLFGSTLVSLSMIGISAFGLLAAVQYHRVRATRIIRENVIFKSAAAFIYSSFALVCVLFAVYLLALDLNQWLAAAFIAPVLALWTSYAGLLPLTDISIVDDPMVEAMRRHELRMRSPEDDSWVPMASRVAEKAGRK